MPILRAVGVGQAGGQFVVLVLLGRAPMATLVVH